MRKFRPEVIGKMYGTMQQYLQEKLAGIQNAGLYKRERVIAGPQQPLVSVADGAASPSPVLNLLRKTTISGWRIIPRSSKQRSRRCGEWAMAWPAYVLSAAPSPSISNLRIV